MGRRNSSTFEDLVEIISRLPWWVGVVLAAVLYFWLHSVAVQPVAIAIDMQHVGDSVGRQMWHTFAIFLQYILPAACLLGAAISAIQQYKRKSSAMDRSGARFPSSGAQSSATDMACPSCGAPMVKRLAKRGANAGQAFWGCSRYPACKGIRN